MQSYSAFMTAYQDYVKDFVHNVKIVQEFLYISGREYGSIHNCNVSAWVQFQKCSVILK